MLSAWDDLCSFDSSTPSVHATSQGMDKVEALGKEIGELTQHYLRCMDRIKLREAIKTAMSISAAGNKFFQVLHKGYLVLVGAGSVGTMSCHHPVFRCSAT